MEAAPTVNRPRELSFQRTAAHAFQQSARFRRMADIRRVLFLRSRNGNTGVSLFSCPQANVVPGTPPRSTNPMSYLDVSPMIVALRTTPDHFEYKGGWLNHVPSRHSFSFDQGRHVRIMAHCNCATLAVKPEQESELYGTFRQWETSYWRPLLVNREFASHFKPRSFVRRWLIDLTGRLHRRLSQGSPGREAAAMAPAE
jgi:hypothetical protein